MAAIRISFLFLCALLQLQNVLALPCVPRYFGTDKMVCVCNVTYCDTLDRPQEQLAPGIVYVVQTSLHGDRFEPTTMIFQTHSEESHLPEGVLRVRVDSSKQFQEIIGFGGSFTDATGINIVSLPESMRKDLIDAYFSAKGSEYNIGRVPIASTDFSTRAYSYDDVVGDLNLDHFQLAPEDFQYKIPIIHKAMSVSTQPILLFGSPWAPPGWMKTNNNMVGDGFLKGEVGGEYYQSWANYFVKFLEAYQENNLTFWGLTVENEPLNCFVTNFVFQCLGFTAETQRAFVVQNLGPALKNAGYGVDKVKLMIMDDQRFLLPSWPKTIFSDPAAADFVSGIAFHWYYNTVAPPTLLDTTHDLFPDKFLLASEACEGWPILGDWSRAESYAHDIIEDLLHWTVGWVDWNLALNTDGGPSFVTNNVDSPILVNATAQEFYKQPTYYAMAHFSKFIKAGSKRILTDPSVPNAKMELAAFKTPDGNIVLVAVNRHDTPVTMDIVDVAFSHFVRHTIPGHSFQTYLWRESSG